MLYKVGASGFLEQVGMHMFRNCSGGRGVRGINLFAKACPGRPFFCNFTMYFQVGGGGNYLNPPDKYPPSLGSVDLCMVGAIICKREGGGYYARAHYY